MGTVLSTSPHSPPPPFPGSMSQKGGVTAGQYGICLCMVCCAVKYACMRSCVRACIHACVRACVCICVHVCACVSVCHTYTHRVYHRLRLIAQFCCQSLCRLPYGQNGYSGRVIDAQCVGDMLRIICSDFVDDFQLIIRALLIVMVTLKHAYNLLLACHCMVEHTQLQAVYYISSAWGIPGILIILVLK